MNVIDSINERGWANGWHAQRLAEDAKREGKTMANLFRERLVNAVAFNVPAKAIRLKGDRLTYQFNDGSTDVFLHQRH